MSVESPRELSGENHPKETPLEETTSLDEPKEEPPSTPISNEVGVESPPEVNGENIPEETASLNESKEPPPEESEEIWIEDTRWIMINIPIKKRNYELGVYEKAEIRTRYEMKENRAMRMYNVYIEGGLLEVGDRVIRIGDVHRGYKKREYKEEMLPGTIMSKYAGYRSTNNS